MIPPRNIPQPITDGDPNSLKRLTGQMCIRDSPKDVLRQCKLHSLYYKNNNYYEHHLDCFDKKHPHHFVFLPGNTILQYHYFHLYLHPALRQADSTETVSYTHLVTTSPQLPAPPSTAPSKRLGHWLRAFPTPMV